MSALAESSGENGVVDLPTPDNREHRHAQRRYVNQILEARAEELFRHVRAELVRVGMEHALIGGARYEIEIGGGASKMAIVAR